MMRANILLYITRNLLHLSKQNINIWRYFIRKPQETLHQVLDISNGRLLCRVYIVLNSIVLIRSGINMLKIASIYFVRISIIHIGLALFKVFTNTNFLKIFEIITLHNMRNRKLPRCVSVFLLNSYWTFSITKQEYPLVRTPMLFQMSFIYHHWIRSRQRSGLISFHGESGKLIILEPGVI